MRQLREDLAEAVDQGTSTTTRERQLREAVKQAQVLFITNSNTKLHLHLYPLLFNRHVKQIY
jgi:hypothetical protein